MQGFQGIPVLPGRSENPHRAIDAGAFSPIIAGMDTSTELEALAERLDEKLSRLLLYVSALEAENESLRGQLAQANAGRDALSAEIAVVRERVARLIERLPQEEMR
jgi:tRNA isopentenyl-2-thiomethyl-A-37 hydroxylase MiaE